jgi:hypothetical protein
LRYSRRTEAQGLVDDNIFSSAESFAAFCRGSGWATLVGGYTAACGAEGVTLGCHEIWEYDGGELGGGYMPVFRGLLTEEKGLDLKELSNMACNSVLRGW